MFGDTKAPLPAMTDWGYVSQPNAQNPAVPVRTSQPPADAGQPTLPARAHDAATPSPAPSPAPVPTQVSHTSVNWPLVAGVGVAVLGLGALAVVAFMKARR